MKRRLRVYKKTVSIVNETAIGMYESLVGNKKGFLLESYDKNYDRYTFFGKEPEEIITSRGDALVIRQNLSEIWDMILSAMRKYCRITIQTRLESRPSR